MSNKSKMIHNSRCLRQFYVKNLKFLSRNIKTKVEEPKIKYTDTINLPKTKFPARLNQNQKSDVEKSIRAVSQLMILGLKGIN